MKIFVYGWYGHGNLGDEAFQPSIKNLFHTLDLHFGDFIPCNINVSFDALWVGGGSFLDQRIKGIENVTIPIGFIGVGIGHTIDVYNEAALNRAKFVIVRDHLSLQMCPQAFLATDLVFSRKDIKPTERVRSKKAVILLNDFLSPKWNNQEWQSLSYYRFIQEFAKACDSLISKGYTLHFYPMCFSSVIDDRRVAAAIIGRLQMPGKAEWRVEKTTEQELLSQISRADLVITQRFHGAIYSILLNRTFIAISSHDKLRGLATDCDWKGIIDYYGFTDAQFFKILDHVEKRTVIKEYAEKAQKRWGELAEFAVKLMGS
jgi:polysaccharide pyruvyl transferase WcaK-like protein